jgi:hypothetical protein
MTSQREIEAWTSRRSVDAPAAPDREAWLELGRLLDASVPAGDDARLLERVLAEVRKPERRPALPTVRPWLESAAALSGVAALVVLAFLWNAAPDSANEEFAPAAQAALAAPWEDDVLARSEALADAAADFTRADSIEGDFAQVEQWIESLAEELENAPL